MTKRLGRSQAAAVCRYAMPTLQHFLVLLACMQVSLRGALLQRHRDGHGAEGKQGVELVGGEGDHNIVTQIIVTS
jgi:hypothetical protein